MPEEEVVVVEAGRKLTRIFFSWIEERAFVSMFCHCFVVSWGCLGMCGSWGGETHDCGDV